MEESSVGGTTSRFRITALGCPVLAVAESHVLRRRWTLMVLIKLEVLERLGGGKERLGADLYSAADGHVAGAVRHFLTWSAVMAGAGPR